MTSSLADQSLTDDFEAPSPQSGALIVDIEGFEGPLDVLLALARNHKVDLREISMLALAEQYLSFIETLRDKQIELAADYLVMAAWLTYLKSRLLLPEDKEDGPSGAELAARLAFQLQRLEAMRGAAGKLFAGYRLGRDMFKRGAPEPVKVNRIKEFDANLFDMLSAYAAIKARGVREPYVINRPLIYAVEDALKRLSNLIGHMIDWNDLVNFLPPELQGEAGTRTAVASTFAASLELVKRGTLELRQAGSFGPIQLRRRLDAGTELAEEARG